MLPMALFQLFLTSVLLTIGGVCLHTALRSDRSERQSILLLRTLVRLEQQLRADERDSRTVIVQSPTELVFSDLSDQRELVTWRTASGSVERLEGDLSSPNGRES
jgi:type II secretory pathway component PulJ